jgi:hypothetical protein
VFNITLTPPPPCRSRPAPLQGCAVMSSPVRILTPQQQDPQAGGWTAEFGVEWLRLVELPFPQCRGLRNPLNDNLPISRYGTGGRRVPSVGWLSHE